MLIIITISLGLFIFLHCGITEEALKSRLVTKVPTPYEGLHDSGNSSTEQKAKRLPQAIIIGSRKCGTRALLKFLGLNPAVRAAQNEVHFFDKPQNFRLGFDWYRSQMPESEQDEVTIEKSPAYFVTQDVPERVKSMNSSIKLVLILRDPVTRLISDYSQLVANKIAAIEEDEESDYNIIGVGNYSEYYALNDFNQSIWDKAEREFENYILRPDGGIDDQRKAIKIGMYSIYLEKWRASFPIEQFHFVDGETLIRNPYEELHKLELFLGLKPTIEQSDFVFNHKKGFFCIASNNINVNHGTVSKSKPGVGGKTNNGASRATCLSRSKGRRHVTVRKELIEALRKFYSPYNEYFYSLTGTRFNWG